MRDQKGRCKTWVWSCYSDCLQEPPSRRSNVRHRDRLLLTQALLNGQIPLKRIRLLKMRIKSKKPPRCACIRGCDLGRRGIGRTKRECTGPTKRGTKPEGQSTIRVGRATNRVTHL